MRDEVHALLWKRESFDDGWNGAGCGFRAISLGMAYSGIDDWDGQGRVRGVVGCAAWISEA